MATEQRLPRANLADIPELMPGALPSGNPAQKAEFEQRCKQLHHDAVAESTGRAAATSYSGTAATVDELATMFPSLDADLVRVIAGDFPTPQHAIETLLTLVASSSEPTEPPLPPKDLPLEDMDMFPSLTDADGWQVADKKQFERDPEEELGSAWRDRAKEAAPMPAPKSAWTSGVPSSKRRGDREKEEQTSEVALPETDYETRHRRGQQKARNRAQFGRGGVRLAGLAGRGNRGNAAGDDSESEDEEDDERGEDDENGAQK